MLAQRAGAQITLYDNLESQLEEVAYFNGPGVIFNYSQSDDFFDVKNEFNEIKYRFANISSKVSRHVIFDYISGSVPQDIQMKVDLTAKLGSHVHD